VIKGALESAGIAVVLRDEYLVGANWLYSDAVGGVAVAVGERDLPRAAEIVDAARGNSGRQSRSRSLGGVRLAGMVTVAIISLLMVPQLLYGLLLFGRGRMSQLDRRD
jgi:hypothetical protein